MHRTAVPGLLFGLLIAWIGSSDALAQQSKEHLFEQCQQEAKNEFGDRKVTFDTFRRRNNSRFAFGTIELNDGSTVQIRCRTNRGVFRSIRFRGESERAGHRWIMDRPPAELIGAPTAPEAPVEEEAAGDGQPETPDTTPETAAVGEPEAGQPEAEQPEAALPVVRQPPGAQPEAVQQQTAQPEGVQPETGLPVVRQPPGSQPEAGQQQTAQPEGEIPLAQPKIIRVPPSSDTQ